MKIKRIVKGIIFICLLAGLLVGATIIFQGKWTDETAPTLMAEQFYNLEENSVEICILGSSQTSYGISSMRMLEKEGVSAFNTGTGSQPTVVNYFYLKEMDKTQEIKAVFFETSMLFEKVEASRIKMAANTAPYSENKKELINNYLGEDASWSEKAPYYFSLLSGHSRWNDLSQKDFDYKNMEWDMYRGSILKDGSRSDMSPERILVELQGDEPISIDPDEEKYLYKIIDYCKEKDLPLVFFKTPKSSWSKNKYEIVKQIADEQGITYLDFNTTELSEAMDLEYEQDFTDPDHLNAIGAEKLSEYLAKYMVENFDLRDMRKDDSYNEEEMSAYRVNRKNKIIRCSKNLKAILKAARENDLEIIMQSNEDIVDQMDEGTIEAFESIGISKDELRGNFVCHIVNGKCIFKKNDKDPISYSGNLSDGKTFKVRSDIEKDDITFNIGTGQHVSIKDGINMVIYDNVKSKVLWYPAIAISDQDKTIIK